MNIKQCTLAVAAAGSVLGLSAQADTFSYSAGDLLLGFRSTSSSSDVVVNLGAVSTYLSATSAFQVSAFTSGQLTSTFGSLNNLYFSVFGSSYGTALAVPANTLWLSSPRADANTPTDPANSLSQFAQGNVVSYLNAVAGGATSTTLGVTVLSSTVVVEPAGMNVSGTISYYNGIGNQYFANTSGNIHGTWGPYVVEGLTSATFGTDTTPVVLDLYQQNSGTANAGQYVGSFTLANDGTMTFTPAAVPEPTTWALLGAGLATLAVLRRRQPAN